MNTNLNNLRKNKYRSQGRIYVFDRVFIKKAKKLNLRLIFTRIISSEQKCHYLLLKKSFSETLVKLKFLRL